MADPPPVQGPENGKRPYFGGGGVWSRMRHLRHSIFPGEHAPVTPLEHINGICGVYKFLQKLTQHHPPPPSVNSWIRHWTCSVARPPLGVVGVRPPPLPGQLPPPPKMPLYCHYHDYKTKCTSQGKIEKNLKLIPYQNIFVPRSCIRSGLATQNLFTLDIHRRIFRRVKSKMADYLTEIT